MLYNNTVHISKCNLNMFDINKMNEVNCKEYNNLYNSELQLNDYMVFNTTEKSKLAFSVLNEDQKKVVCLILQTISCSFNPSGVLLNPKVMLLDAPSGTGKSFLIDCLYLCLRYTSMCVIARNKSLLNYISTIKAMKTMTTCKFIMTYFNMVYENAISVFRDIYISIEDVKSTIESVISNYKKWNFNLLIIDEYSMESPLLLMTLLIIAKKENVNVIIIGDIKQQNTLTPSRFHKDTNYNLLKILKDIHMYELKEQMRIKDKALNNLISGIKLFINNDSLGNIKTTFQLKYFIYENLKLKFLKKGSLLNDIYVTDTHKNIKKRVEKLENYLKNNNISYVLEPFEVQNQQLKSTLILPNNDKFLPYLLLIEGGNYLYNKSKFVKIIKINENSLDIKDINSNEKFNITKSIWNKHNHECVDVNFNWLNSFVEEGYNLIQYPLRLTMFTYYFIQGLTFKQQSVCIDLDSIYANSLYVGFSRVTTIDQITEIESKDFLSMLYTEYKNDEYFYKIPKPTDFIINNLLMYYKDANYKFDDSKIKFTEVNLSMFDKCNNTLKYVKTLKENSVCKNLKLNQVNNTVTQNISELGKLLLDFYEFNIEAKTDCSDQ